MTEEANEEEPAVEKRKTISVVRNGEGTIVSFNLSTLQLLVGFAGALLALMFSVGQLLRPVVDRWVQEDLATVNAKIDTIGAQIVSSSAQNVQQIEYQRNRDEFTRQLGDIAAKVDWLYKHEIEKGKK